MSKLRVNCFALSLEIERMRVVGHERAALTVCSTPSPHGIDSLKARLSPIAQAIRWEIPGPAVM